VRHHASVLAYDAQLDAARTDVALARADRRADWSLELAYSNRARPYSDMVSLEFRVGLPIFASRRQDPVIAARSAQLHRVESEREAALRMHSAEIAKELANWETARRGSRRTNASSFRSPRRACAPRSPLSNPPRPPSDRCSRRVRLPRMWRYRRSRSSVNWVARGPT